MPNKKKGGRPPVAAPVSQDQSAIAEAARQKAAADNRSRQLDLQNNLYWLSRGQSRPTASPGQG